MRLPLLVAILAVALPTLAQAASFDCAKARRPDERAICADKVLNDKDVRTAVIYEINRKTMGMGAREALMDDQQAFLKVRADCRANRACIGRAYDRRLEVLERDLERVYRAGPF